MPGAEFSGSCPTSSLAAINHTALPLGGTGVVDWLLPGYVTTTSSHARIKNRKVEKTKIVIRFIISFFSQLLSGKIDILIAEPWYAKNTKVLRQNYLIFILLVTCGYKKVLDLQFRDKLYFL